MVLNYIWIAFFLIAFVIALAKVRLLGDTEIFTAIINSTFDASKTAFEISLGLTGVLALWLGIMKTGENSGLITSLVPMTDILIYGANKQRKIRQPIHKMLLHLVVPLKDNSLPLQIVWNQFFRGSISKAVCSLRLALLLA